MATVIIVAIVTLSCLACFAIVMRSGMRAVLRVGSLLELQFELTRRPVLKEKVP